MLKFLGFIALLAIIFGVSFGAALAGFVRFVVIAVAILVAIGIVVKMLESEKGAKFVLAASVLAVVFGIYLINDPGYAKRIETCDIFLNDVNLHVDCMVSAMDDHNELINKGWGFAICGTIAGLFSVASFGEKTENSAKNHAKKR